MASCGEVASFKGPKSAFDLILKRYPWMSLALFCRLLALARLLLVFVIEAVMSVSAAEDAGHGWCCGLVLVLVLVLVKTVVVYSCCCHIVDSPMALVELLLLVGGLAAALVSVFLNYYYMLYGWDLLPGLDLIAGWDLLAGWNLLHSWVFPEISAPGWVFHEVSVPGWVWMRLGTLQLLLGLTFSHLVVVEERFSCVQLGMVVPVFLQFLGVPLLPELVLLLVLLMWNLVLFMKYQRNWYDDNFDITRVLTAARHYWILRVLVKALIHLYGLQVRGWSWSGLSNLSADLLVSGCESCVTELAMDATIAFVALYFLSHFIRFLGLNEEYLTLSNCWIVGMQWGVSSMDPTQRLEILLQNMYLLLVLGLTHLHQLAHPFLTAWNTPWQIFIPLFVFSILTLFFPIPLMLVIWQHYDCGIWLFTATAFSLHLFLQVLLGLYVFVGGSLIRNIEERDWKLARAILLQHQVELVFGALMVAVNAYGLVFDSRRFSHLLLMPLHIHIHIFFSMENYLQQMIHQELRKRMYKRRYKRVKWHVTLTEAQLQLIDDVCSICLLPFRSDSSLTACSHYFHLECLRMWLYSHQTCPKCSSYVEKGEVPEETNQPWWEEQGEGPQEEPREQVEGLQEEPREQGEGLQEEPREQGEGPQEEPREQGEGPQEEPREQGEGPQEEPREQGEGPQEEPREQGEGPQEEPREQGEGPQEEPREQGEGPQEEPREQGEGPQEEPREQGEGPQEEPREQGEGPQEEPREQGEGPQEEPREQGEGPQEEPREQGEGPQGEGPQEEAREQSEGLQEEPREQGEGPVFCPHF